MKPFVIILLLFSFLSPNLFAQKNVEEEVRKVIDQMFDGMREGDSSKVHAVMADDVKFYTSAKRDQFYSLSEGSLQRFLKSVGTPHDQVYDERISEVKIHVDDHLATVWMNYRFYLGDKFSHCGVNTMTLHKEEEGWKIFFLADTRRKSDCLK